MAAGANQDVADPRTDPDKKKRWQQLSTPGIPDLMGWIPKRGVLASFTVEANDGNPCAVPLYIEVKRPGKNVRRPAQERFIEEAKLDGCVAFFAESWGDVVRELGLFGIHLKEA